MTPLELARKDWEGSSHACPKIRRRKDLEWVEEFRQYGKAKAWIEWDSNPDVITISKIQTLAPCQGEATRLVGFLKKLADKYHLRIFGNPVSNPSDEGVPEHDLLTQERLEQWYVKRGFQLRSYETHKEIWYPPAPNDAGPNRIANPVHR